MIFGRCVTLLLIRVPSEDDNTIITSPFQEDEVDGLHSLTIDDNPIPNHPDGGVIDIEEEDDDDEEDIEPEIDLSDDNRDGASGSGAERSGGSSSSSVGLSGPVGDMTLEGPSRPEVDAEGRRRVSVQDGQLMPPHQVASAITCNFKKFLHPTGYTWKMVPQERREQYMEEFQVFYYIFSILIFFLSLTFSYVFNMLQKEWFWDPAEDAAIWAAWSVKAGERYKDIVYGFKRNRTKGCPPYVPHEMWECFKAYWGTDAFKKKSEVSSKNHLSEPDGPGTGIVKHRGGSRSAVAHAATLRNKIESIETGTYKLCRVAHGIKGLIPLLMENTWMAIYISLVFEISQLQYSTS
ncbi:hypothetical protein C2S53_003261 [Perilla frutescens var. hirtella]|uniref:Uncharacterized protein n=1 Tax=Perilla frutescens var. hirtella TaxID=608512 RepID=A0AAD4IUI2_PERFH|nr:hypothetical protein C2S53_003261 [Perilla frutescens var. hirtella]